MPACAAPTCTMAMAAFNTAPLPFPRWPRWLLDFFPPTGLPGAHRLLDSRLNGRYGRSLWGRRSPLPSILCWGPPCLCAARPSPPRAPSTRSSGCTARRWTGACACAKRAGGVYVAPDVRVIHHEAQSSRQVRWRAFARLWQSRFAFYTKHRRRYGLGYLPVLRLLVRLGVAAQRRAVQAAVCRAAPSTAASGGAGGACPGACRTIMHL